MVSDQKGASTWKGAPKNDIVRNALNSDWLGTCRLGLQTIIKCLAIKSHYDVVIKVSFNKNQGLESKDAKKDPEMSANIAKVTRISRAS